MIFEEATDALSSSELPDSSKHVALSYVDQKQARLRPRQICGTQTFPSLAVLTPEAQARGWQSWPRDNRMPTDELRRRVATQARTHDTRQDIADARRAICSRQRGKPRRETTVALLVARVPPVDINPRDVVGAARRLYAIPEREVEYFGEHLGAAKARCSNS